MLGMQGTQQSETRPKVRRHRTSEHAKKHLADFLGKGKRGGGHFHGREGKNLGNRNTHCLYRYIRGCLPLGRVYYCKRKRMLRVCGKREIDKKTEGAGGVAWCKIGDCIRPSSRRRYVIISTLTSSVIKVVSREIKLGLVLLHRQKVMRAGTITAKQEKSAPKKESEMDLETKKRNG